MPDISVVIPAYNEACYLPKCLEATEADSNASGLEVETVVVLNGCTDATGAIAAEFGAVTVEEELKNIARVRNTGVRASSAECVLTIDADSYFTEGTLKEIKSLLEDPAVIAGGCDFQPERKSLPILISYGISKWLAKRAGGSMALYWFRRSAFDAIGGFDEQRIIGEDIDFSSRLSTYAEVQGGRYEMLSRGQVVTSCRKFDQFGDWYALKLFMFESARARSMMDGSNQEDLDRFYYKTRD